MIPFARNMENSVRGVARLFLRFSWEGLRNIIHGRIVRNVETILQYIVACVTMFVGRIAAEKTV